MKKSLDIFKWFLIVDIINFGMLSFVLFIFCINICRIIKKFIYIIIIYFIIGVLNYEEMLFYSIEVLINDGKFIIVMLIVVEIIN